MHHKDICKTPHNSKTSAILNAYFCRLHPCIAYRVTLRTTNSHKLKVFPKTVKRLTFLKLIFLFGMVSAAKNGWYRIGNVDYIFSLYLYFQKKIHPINRCSTTSILIFVYIPWLFRPIHFVCSCKHLNIETFANHDQIQVNPRSNNTNHSQDRKKKQTKPNAQRSVEIVSPIECLNFNAMERE